MKSDLTEDSIYSLSPNQRKDLVNFSIKQLPDKSQKLLLRQKFWLKKNNLDISKARISDPQNKLPISETSIYKETKEAIAATRMIMLENYNQGHGFSSDQSY